MKRAPSRPLLLALAFVVVLGLGFVPAPRPAAARDDEQGLPTRIHDVGPLVGAAREPEVVVLGLPPSGLAFRPEDEDEEEPPTWLTGDALVDLVLSSVPGPWEDDDRTTVAFEGDRLVVRADAATQEAVERFLARLWSGAMGRVELTGRRLGFDAAARERLAERGLLEPLATGRLDARTVAALVETASSASAASTRVRPGQRGTLGHVASTTYVRDYDVEIAMDSRVGNPVVSTLATGWFLAVRPYALQDGSLLLEVVGQAADPEEPMRRQALEVEPFGTVDLPACRVLRLAGGVRLAPGVAVAYAAALRGDRGPLDVLLLAARRVGEAARATGTPRRYDVSALGAVPPTWRLTHEPFPGSGFPDAGALNPPRFVRVDVEDAVAPPEALMEEIQERMGPDVWERDGVWMTTTGSALLASHDADVLDDIGEILRQREGALDGRRLRVRLLAAADGEADETLAEAGLDCPFGRSVAWQCGEERAYVADWDVEVAQEARTGDPRVGTVFGGLALQARLEPAPLARTFALGLALSFTRLDPEMETRRTHNDCTGVIDVPRASRLDLQQELVLSAGDVQRLDAGTLEDGRRLLVEVTLGR